MAIDIRTEMPGPKSRALMAVRQAEVARGLFHATPIFVARAHGAVVEDVDGNRLLDFASGIAVVNLGHTPDTVVAAVRGQAEDLLHASFNVLPYEGYVELCARLNRLTPGLSRRRPSSPTAAPKPSKTPSKSRASTPAVKPCSPSSMPFTAARTWP
ncbi:Gamma-aminobutyrate:alpha-ketoglutarate aminotransferase [Minicystis rosea]|nr:Gamma-aminobutyrate:alpha-ketoglutarate aminotransferase [Minicystis rosea]